MSLNGCPELVPVSTVTVGQAADADLWILGPDWRLNLTDLKAKVTELEHELAQHRSTLLAIVNTRDGRHDNVWQRMARARLDGTAIV